MDVLDEIAERRIAEAYARGGFAGLPGEGRALPLQAQARYFERLLERLQSVQERRS